MTVYLNGAFLPRADARVPVDDRGFLFGDGVYEVTRAHGGVLFEAARHLRRLDRSLDGVAIALAPEVRAALLGVWERLLGANGLETGDATVYLQVTRGVAERRHQFPPRGTLPTVFASASRLQPPDELRERGATVILTPDLRWGRCDLKTINLLPNVLAKQRAVAAGAFEAVLVRNGVVTEGASSNVFALLDGTLWTHPATPAILAGITREVVLELAHEAGIPVREEALSVPAFAEAAEIFVTATTADVMPVVRVDDRVVGGGRPGPVARGLAAALRARLDGAAARATSPS